MDIFQMSLSGAVLIIAVVICRSVTLHKLPKMTFLVLWGVVICRLLIPFYIPSRFSFYTGIALLRRIMSGTATFTASLRMIGNTGTVTDTNNTNEIGATTVSVSPVMIIWLIGSCVCALFFIIAYIKCCREFKESLPVENDFATHWLREHSVSRSVQIRQCDKIKAPLTYGVFHPVVLLPKATDWTDETRLRYILTHEFVHIRRFDTLTKLLLAFALCVHWFNPFVWVMYVLANRDIELSCDETVVQTFGETIKSAYAMTLINMEEKKNGITPLCNNFSNNAIEERIICIMKIKKVTSLSVIMAIILVVGTATAFTSSASAADKSKESLNQYVALTAETALQNGLTINQTAISYNDYENWLGKYKIMIQKEVQNGRLSQQNADKSIQEHEQILTNIQNGDQVSLIVDATEEKVIIIPLSDFKVSENEDGVITIK
nr:M56 family metallopeptidase [uncultured Caproiciproducens sp.]